jgi:general secretion pathway protein K
MKRGRTASRGIALVLVMWVLSLLTVMALALTQIQRTEGALTANQLDSARFRAQANAVMSVVALNLLSTPPSTFEEQALVWVPDGQPRLFQLDGEEFLVTLSNEASKLNLNEITREQLVALIEVVQGTENQDELLRDQLADAILDWRDENDLALLNGAEDADYEAEGLSYGARDGPFRSLEKLRQVLGMSRYLYERLVPYLTIEETEGEVNEAFASAPVLVAVNGYLLDQAQTIVEERSQGLFGEDSEGQLSPLDRGGPRYHLRITQRRLGNRGPTMDAMIRIEPGGQDAFEVLWQRFGSTAGAAAPAGFLTTRAP